MRVISGSARGLNLTIPRGDAVRPTADRVKEALFSMISPDIYGAVFLDIFSGSGAIGIEALSRGAESCVFIDNSAEALMAIEKNLSHAGLSGKATVLRGDATRVLSGLSSGFDIIFLDPPYNQNHISAAVGSIVSSRLLLDGGYIIAEHSNAEDTVRIPGLEAYKEKKYGISKLIFYRMTYTTSRLDDQK